MNRYHTFNRRVMASFVDIVVFIPLIILDIWLQNQKLTVWAELLWPPVSSLFYFSYNIGMHWKYGQTLGKMATRVKVLDVSEAPISFGQACLRDIFYILFEIFFIAATWYFVLAGFGRNSENEIELTNYGLILTIVWIGLNVLVCLKSAKRRAIHDLIAGTVVVRLDMLNDSVKMSEKQLDPPGPEHYDELRDRRSFRIICVNRLLHVSTV